MMKSLTTKINKIEHYQINKNTRYKLKKDSEILEEKHYNTDMHQHEMIHLKDCNKTIGM